MKKEIIITAVVVVALVAGITYYKSTRNALLDSTGQPTASPDWRKAVGHSNNTATYSNPEDPLVIIPDLTGNGRDSSQFETEPLDQPGKSRNFIQSDDRYEDEDGFPYWEADVEAADDPEFYQPSDDAESESETPVLVDPTDNPEAAL